MNDTIISSNAKVERTVIDKEVWVGEGAEIGYGVDNVPNRRYPERLNTGLTVIGKRARIPASLKVGHNVIINPHITEAHFQTDFVASGETI
jgi:glucose-1-phosphate adenylyltransferase